MARKMSLETFADYVAQSLAIAALRPQGQELAALRQAWATRWNYGRVSGSEAAREALHLAQEAWARHPERLSALALVAKKDQWEAEGIFDYAAGKGVV